MKLRFELPSKEYQQAATEYIKEFIKHDSDINGTGGLDIDNYDSWLVSTLNYHKGICENEKYVPASTYFIFNEEDILVGMSNIRHELNEYLASSGSGHIGYSVRPTERQKGYATEILRKSLEILHHDFQVVNAMLGCYKHNVGSRKTILNNDGVFVKDILEEDNLITEVYNIYLGE